MVTEEKVRQIPVTRRRTIWEERVQRIPIRACKMEAFEKTIRVPRRVERRVAVTYTCRVPRTVCCRVPLDPCMTPMTCVEGVGGWENADSESASPLDEPTPADPADKKPKLPSKA